MKIILYSDDILLIEHWEKSLEEKTFLVESLEELYKIENNLLIINYSACQNKCKELLVKLSKKNKVLILHRTPDINTAKTLLKYGAKGYGNALMREHFIFSAVETIKEGMLWLHPEFTTALITEIPKQRENTNQKNLNLLSQREREVALLLKDGATYKEVALELGITPRTIKAHATHIYQKLNVKDRIGLALFLK